MKFKAWVASIMLIVFVMLNLLSVEVFATAETEELLIINKDTVWSYMDNGEDPAVGMDDRTAWTQAEFDDTGWKTGSGSFAYKNGADDMNGHHIDNQVCVFKSNGGGDRIETYFFRAKFSVDIPEAYSSILGTVLYDDAAILYLNGTRIAAFADIARNPDGTEIGGGITSNLQYGGANGAGPDSGNILYEDDLVSLLKQGENTIAVEIHQAHATSSDIYFELPELKLSNGDATTTYRQSNLSLYVGGTKAEVSVTWYTDAQTPGYVSLARASELIGGAMPEDAQMFSAVSAPTCDTDGPDYYYGPYSNKVTLNGLAPDTEYAYQVVNGGTKGRVYTFKTANDGPFSFVFCTDAQFGSMNWYATDAWNNNLKKINTTDNFRDISILVHTGDQINGWGPVNAVEWMYDCFLENSTLRGLPIATNIGSHDSDTSSGHDAGISYRQHFTPPNESTAGVNSAGGDYYFVYNNVLFMALNTTNWPYTDTAAVETLTAEHKAFMEQAIMATSNLDIRWKIVTAHYSIYSAGAHANEENIVSRRQALAPVFKKLGVDLVLSGHDHSYCRSYIMGGEDGMTPITEVSCYDNQSYASITDPDGVLYVTGNSATGNALQYDLQNEQNIPYAKVTYQEPDNLNRSYFSRVDVSDNSLTITTWQMEEDKLIDSFTINHSQSCTHSYSAQVKAPTCTEEGETTYTCSKCGDTYTGAVTPALGHSYGEWFVVTPATDTTDGTKERTCSRCGVKETGSISATGGGSGENNYPSGNYLYDIVWNPVSAPSIVHTSEFNNSNQTMATPRATISGNKATSTIDTSTANEIIKQAVGNNSTIVEIAPVISRTVTQTQVSIPASTVGEIGRRTNAGLSVSTSLATVTIPNSGLSELGSSKGNVIISVEREGSAVEVSVTAGNRQLQSINGGITLTIPVAGADPNTVAMLVYEDGTAEVIRKSVLHNGKLSIPLDGSFKLLIADNQKSFTDVQANSWMANAVAFVSAHELFDGTNANLFSPNIPMSRGMISVVLHNLENNPKSTFLNTFSDVSNGAWYEEAVSWTSEEGIITGYGNGLFGPADEVTREQLAVILWRYAGQPVSSEHLQNFIDSDQVHDYAWNALCWAVEKKIINGEGSGILNPLGAATRAEVAQMLTNFLTLDGIYNK